MVETSLSESLIRNIDIHKKDRVIGWGLGKAGEVTAAIAKGVESAKKNLTRVPVLKGTVPHEPVSYTHLDVYKRQ